MAYINVQDAPGINCVIVDRTGADAPGLLTADGTHFNGSAINDPVTPNSAGAGVRLEVSTGYAFPFNVRVTSVCGSITFTSPFAGPAGGDLEFNATGLDSSTLPTSPTGSDTMTGSSVIAAPNDGFNNFAICRYGTDPGFTITIGSMQLLIEIDGVYTPSDGLWTDLVGAEEPDGVTLLKPQLGLVVPGTAGQPFLPASDNCYPPIPDPPSGGQPGGGNGSGPPHGDCVQYPLYQQQYICNTLTIGGNTVTSCSWQDVIVGFVQVCP